MMPKRVTIADVAQAAQVSKSVVSTVLSGRGGTVRCSAATRQQILEVARRIHYRPSLIARGLHQKKSYLIAYFGIAGGGLWTSSRYIQYLQEACQENHYSLIVYLSESLEEEQRNLQLALERQVDGIIVFPYLQYDVNNFEHYRQIEQSGTPVVVFLPDCPGLNCVYRDSRLCAQDGARRLYRPGRRILFLTYHNYLNPVTGPESYCQYQGYLQASQELGFTPEVCPIDITQSDFSTTELHKAIVLELSYAQSKRYFAASGTVPEALLASNNSLAYGAGLAARELGIEVPDQLEIISCNDDYILPRMIFPDLACFSLDAPRFARQAVAECLQGAPGQVTYVPQKFQPGNSLKKQ